jgi:hypothetical protein
MLNVLKILATIMMARSASSKLDIAKQLLARVAVIAGLALMITILAGSFVMAGIYYGYTLLIDGGYSQPAALAITAGSLLAIIAGLVFLTLNKLHELNDFPHMFAEAEAPITHKVQSAAESFLNGLLKRGTDNTKYKTN